MRSKRHPDGYPFTKDTLTAMLDNPFYAGWVTNTADGRGKRNDNTKLIKGQHQPLISQELFDRCLAVRATKRNPGSTEARHSHTYTAGGGLARCSCCRQPLRAQGAVMRKPSYRDVSRERGIAFAAHRRSIPAPVVDEGVALAVSGLVLPPDWRADAEAHLSAIADERQRIERERGRRLKRRLLCKSGCSWMEILTSPIIAPKARIEAELAALQPPAETTTAEAAANLLRDLTALWERATPEERRDIAAQLFTAVHCDLDSRRVVAVQMNSAFLTLRNALPKCTLGGSDGIRTRGLLRDRQAC